MSNNKGFAALELALIIIVVGIVGFVGYRVFTQKKAGIPVGSNVPNISTAADLDKASKTLDSTDLDALGTYSSQLDSQTKF